MLLMPGLPIIPFESMKSTTARTLATITHYPPQKSGSKPTWKLNRERKANRILSWERQEVWERDGGTCQQCGTADRAELYQCFSKRVYRWEDRNEAWNFSIC